MKKKKRLKKNDQPKKTQIRLIETKQKTENSSKEQTKT